MHVCCVHMLSAGVCSGLLPVFLVGLSVSLLSLRDFFLYILDTSPLLDLGFVNIFS